MDVTSLPGVERSSMRLGSCGLGAGVAGCDLGVGVAALFQAILVGAGAFWPDAWALSWGVRTRLILARAASLSA